MAIEFKLPELGENIEGGDVVNVLVAVGDAVSEGQSILEIEAGKASMEIPSPAAGTITAVHVAQGDTINIGQLAFTIEAGAAAEPAPVPEPPKEAAPVESEPVAEAPAPVVEETPALAPAPAAPAPKAESAPVAAEKAVSAAPNVRRLARELGVDIHDVVPATAGGRINLEDVKSYAKQSMGTGGGANRKPGSTGGTRVEKMSAIRKATMKHMTHCWTTIPHVTQHDMADITKLEELRKRFAPKAEAVGAKLTVTAILLKVVASALKVFPNFNCSIDPEKAEIIYKDFYNIGIAVDTEKGLMVPVIRYANLMSLKQLSAETKRLAKACIEGTVDPDALSGGTFTVTNLGAMGIESFTPVLNAPEVGILGVCNIQPKPVMNKEGGADFVPHMGLSLTFDHAAADGAPAARFLASMRIKLAAFELTLAG